MMQNTNEDFLIRSSAVYELLSDYIQRSAPRNHPEKTLFLIQQMANLAWQAHPGKYADGKIENIAFEIGENLDPILQEQSTDWRTNSFPSPTRNGKRRILHVATEVYKVGGHTRLIKNWILNDKGSTHSLLLTNQKNENVPLWLSKVIAENHGDLIAFPTNAPLLVKSKWLREIARIGFDMIILHHHPDDVVPVVAFATKECPPVAILNHADHVFWLGISVGDTIINLRNSAKRLSECRRFGRHNSLLPVPLGRPDLKLSRSEAREKLNLSEGNIILLSIGSAYKYTPTESHNFFRTVYKILEQNKNCHLFLIGVRWSEKTQYLKQFKHERLHLMGISEDLSLYHSAADVYLEGFPFGSMTALLEAALLGIPFILSYAPSSPLLASDAPSFSESPSNAASEEEYIEQVNQLIRNQEYRIHLGNQMQEKIWSYHIHNWTGTLSHIYAQLENSGHCPNKIALVEKQMLQDDVALSQFDAVRVNDSVFLKFFDRSYHQFTISDLIRFYGQFLALKATHLKHTRKWLGIIKHRLLTTKGSFNG